VNCWFRSTYILAIDSGWFRLICSSGAE
jgi:hypothetical protein